MAHGDADRSAQRLAGLLAARETRIVFAESCTAGLVAATLASVPGISQWLCGSAVTYRSTTKAAWLAVSESDLAEFSAVSPQVARQMSEGVLRKTPEAGLALSITGHLGPNAPPEIDGVVYIGCSIRGLSTPFDSGVTQLRLSATGRLARQAEATQLVLRLAASRLE